MTLDSMIQVLLTHYYMPSADASACFCATPASSSCCRPRPSFVVHSVTQCENDRHQTGLHTGRGRRASGPRLCSAARGRLVSNPMLPQAVLQQKSRKGAGAGRRNVLRRQTRRPVSWAAGGSGAAPPRPPLQRQPSFKPGPRQQLRTP